jgi:hypothetical protein
VSISGLFHQANRKSHEKSLKAEADFPEGRKGAAFWLKFALPRQAYSA